MMSYFQFEKFLVKILYTYRLEILKVNIYKNETFHKISFQVEKKILCKRETLNQRIRWKYMQIMLKYIFNHIQSLSMQSTIDLCLANQLNMKISWFKQNILYVKNTFILNSTVKIEYNLMELSHWVQLLTA